MTGTEGQATYRMGDGQPSFVLHFGHPYVGSNRYDTHLTSTSAPYSFTPTGTTCDGSTFSCVVTPALPSHWRHANLDALGALTPRDLCLPSAHDAGMSALNAHTDCTVLMQSQGVGGQLRQGTRDFDLRPVISGGQYVTRHDSLIDKAGVTTQQGGTGQSVAEITEQINAFTQDNAELIVLNLSHDLNTDAGNSGYPAFTQDEWTALFAQLSQLQQLYRAPDGAADLTQLPLRSFIGAGQAAVVILVEPDGVNLGPYARQGFYPAGAWPTYNTYANTNDLAHMMRDQFSKMQIQPSQGTSFLLSWTSTTRGRSRVPCRPSGNSRIRPTPPSRRSSRTAMGTCSRTFCTRATSPVPSRRIWL
ncbi:hypothetical protein [Deinococcus radiotolerans]|nr:hypothetical protein [Deinococcus radiotolerans]